MGLTLKITCVNVKLLDNSIDIPQSGAVQSATSASYLIGRLDRIVRQALESQLLDAGLTLAQYTALSVLAARPGLSNAQLARRSLVTPQGMNQALAGLLEKGFIRREPHPTQGRVLCVHITSEGKKMLGVCRRLSDGVDAKVLGSLSASHQRQFLEMLHTVTGVG
jgi:DNA-binding MarR family transcriptional regulator